MGFKDLPFKNWYDSDEDDILNDFYIPVLEQAYKYKRLAGFFSSSSLAIAARGILGLLKNNGDMKLIAGAVLSKKDVEAIREGLEKPQHIIEKAMIKDLEDITDDFIKDHIQALSWLVANNKLEIKIAIALDQNRIPIDNEKLAQVGIFHQKIGIFEDNEGNRISFIGSTNESATAWKYNIEDFNVFREWIEAEKPYLEADVKRFDKFWSGNTIRTNIIDISTALRNKLISFSPPRKTDLKLYKWYKTQKRDKKKITLYPYQKEAVKKWLDNGKKGIFEMATGTGKTFTALGCINEVLKKNKKIVIIITCPYQHLIQQWKKEIIKFGISIEMIVADSSSISWKNKLADTLIDISLNNKEKVIVLTTHVTFSSTDFKKIMGQNKDLIVCIIGDEVHGLGAKISRTGLLENYVMRLGLSATPKRWYDDIGTDIVYHYFDGIVYEFDLWEAINRINPRTGKTFLTPYRYIPKFISLNEEELSEYENKSEAIIKVYEKAKEEKEKKEILERLLFQRANIIKNAHEKYRMFERILEEQNNDFEHTIVYCSPQQIDTVMDILTDKQIVKHKFTMEEGTKTEKKYNGLSEREFILKNFAKGKYQVLVAMKCLDEGVDIPPAKKAILLASSGNPREYIQRIGRVIRRYKNKKESIIYDIIVAPSLNSLSGELKNIEMKIFDKELKRYEEIAKNAKNNAEALRQIYNIKNSGGKIK